MIISRITTQQKRHDRYNVYVDDSGKEKYAFSVHESILIEYGLRKGLELDEETVEDLMQKDNRHKSYLTAIHYISFRMRSEKEIREHLRSKDIDEAHISTIIKRLRKEGLSDDNAFAEAFVRSRMETSDKGPEMIRNELLDKGIEDTMIDEALVQFTHDRQLQKAEKVVQKKFRSSSKKAFRQRLQDLQAHLMQKGFTGDVMKEALKTVENQRDDEAEWNALVHQGQKQLRQYMSRYTGFELQQRLKQALYRKGFAGPDIDAFINEYADLSNEHDSI